MAAAGDREWVDVDAAADQAGVSVSTIRNWYSGERPRLRSRLEVGPDGRRRRVVPLTDAKNLARRSPGGGPRKKAAAPKKAAPRKAAPRQARGRTGPAPKKTSARKGGAKQTASKKGTVKKAAGPGSTPATGDDVPGALLVPLGA